MVREIWIVTIRVMQLITTVPWGEFNGMLCMCMHVYSVFKIRNGKRYFNKRLAIYFISI